MKFDSEKDVIEYNSFVFAALLHDIGKFFERSKDIELHESKHEKGSVRFIEAFSNNLKNNCYDLELIKVLVRHHQPENKGSILENDPYFKNCLQDKKEHTWKLISLMKRADDYSCAERIHEKMDRKPKARLVSIFSTVSIVDEYRKDIAKYRYRPGKLDPLRTFPEVTTTSSDDEFKKHYEEFKACVPDVTQYKAFDDIVNAYLNFLEQYTWAIPSDTRFQVADISLYDHLRSTAALAACLYKRHYEALKAREKSHSKKEEFIFIAGDFSGIQNYIFEITNRGSGGAAKRLRARSFFISAFCEATIHKILHTLNLPSVCNLFSAGGKFLLIAPNVQEIVDQLPKVKAEILHEIHKNYFSQFSFPMAWKTFVRYQDEAKVFDFCKVADEMFHRLETEKVQSYQPVFLVTAKDRTRPHWDETLFRLSEDAFKKYATGGDCKICGKGPGHYSDSDEEPDIKVCNICNMNKQIGGLLPKRKFIAFGKGKEVAEQENRVVLFHDNIGQEAYYVDLVDAKDVCSPNHYYLIYDIGKNGNQTDARGKPIIRRNLANHVPTDNGSVVSLEDFSSKWTSPVNGKKYGSDLLGVLKADVDNLGLVFSKGFDVPDRPRKQGKYVDKDTGLPKGTDAKSISRFLTLSRMVELFFSGWIREIMEIEPPDIKDKLVNSMPGIDAGLLRRYLDTGVIDFRKIYTVYSGGDDMVLIGPWETMIMFAIMLNTKFREYTCQSKSLTLSAGLAFVKPKYPIASAIREADTLLQKSKEKGKNRLTLFGTTVEWEQLPRLMDFFLFLNEKSSVKGSGIKRAFLYRLLKYHQTASDFFDWDRVEGLRYLSALSYDIGRNIIQWDNRGNIKKGREEGRALQSLLDDKPDKYSLMYNVKVPLFWALYRNRGTRNEDVGDF